MVVPSFCRTSLRSIHTSLFGVIMTCSPRWRAALASSFVFGVIALVAGVEGATTTGAAAGGSGFFFAFFTASPRSFGGAAGAAVVVPSASSSAFIARR
jgi:hypothetical protein